jgi:hypothetical protein
VLLIESTVATFNGVAERERQSTVSLMSSSNTSSSSDEYHNDGDAVIRCPEADALPNASAKGETRFTCNSPDALENAATYVDGDCDSLEEQPWPDSSKKVGDGAILWPRAS